jgi:imidazoleglycerol-phosphate dehydratase/histidinol-phosphatase
MIKTLFIEKEGTIVSRLDNDPSCTGRKLRFLPGVITFLARISSETDYELVLMTDLAEKEQSSGLGAAFRQEDDQVTMILRGEGVIFKEIIPCGSFCPETSFQGSRSMEVFYRYLARGVSLNQSCIISSNPAIIQAAHNLGCRVICFSEAVHPAAVLNTTAWNRIYSFLKEVPRKSFVSRVTGETNISISLNLDGHGCYRISAGSGFFNHMLEQFAKHSGIDLEIEASGNAEADYHHLIEDTGLALGEAFASALGSKRGIERYGFILPMDDSLAQVAVDFGGRPWLSWSADFNAEKIGSMPSEMIFHFFRSFSDSAGCNINIKAEGSNDHHKAEAIFKAFARAVRMAVRRTEGNDLPSTKGLL